MRWAIGALCVATLALSGSPKAKSDSIAFTLPAPAGNQDFMFLSRWLQLSEAQEAAFAAIAKSHLEASAAALQSRLPELNALADKGGQALVGGAYTQDTVDICAKFFQAQGRYHQAVAALDAELLATISGFLSETQLQSMRHVEQWRQRRRCLVAGWDMRWAAIDLEYVVLSAVAGDGPTLESLRPILIEYADAVTPLFVETDEAATRRSLDGVRIMADAAIPDAAKGQAMAERFDVIARREIELKKRNQTFAVRLRDTLPEPLAATFWRHIETWCWPLTYPDLPMSEAFSEVVIRALSGDQESVERATLMRETQRDELRSIALEMAACEEAWNEQVSTTRSLSGSEQFAATMRKLRNNRFLAHQSFLRALAKEFGPRLPPEERGVLDGSINDISVLMYRAEKDRFPLR